MSTRIRAGALALAVAGLLFVAYPAARPWHNESTVDGATRSMASNWWVAAHAFAMIGFILIPLGLLAVRSVVRHTRAEPVAASAVLFMWLGAGFTLPYYGAEDFGLHAIAERTVTQRLDLLDLVNGVRFGPTQITLFGVGLVLLGVGAIVTAVAVARSGVLPRWSGVVFAVAFALFIPQFFAGAAVRITHGVIAGIGLVWLAAVTWRAADQPAGR
jgi:hypothetical protein